MKTAFVETANWRTFGHKMALLRKSPPEEPRLAVISGRTGLGKTMTVRRYAAVNACVYVRALDIWTPTAMLRVLARELGGHEFHGRLQCFEECKRKLEDGDRHIIIDEADYVAADRHLLNTVRDLHDSAPVTITLVGEERLPITLKREIHAHFWGRVAQTMTFLPLTIQEIALIASETCGLQLAAAEAEAIHAKTKGEFRWVKKHLREVEARMRANGLKEATPEIIKSVGETIQVQRAA